MKIGDLVMVRHFPDVGIVVDLTTTGEQALVMWNDGGIFGSRPKHWR